MKEWGGEEGHPDRTTACAELVVRGDSGERRRGVSEGVKGDPGQIRGREGGEEAAGRLGPVLAASTSFTPGVWISILRAWKGVEGDMFRVAFRGHSG